MTALILVSNSDCIYWFLEITRPYMKYINIHIQHKWLLNSDHFFYFLFKFKILSTCYLHICHAFQNTAYNFIKLYAKLYFRELDKISRWACFLCWCYPHISSWRQTFKKYLLKVFSLYLEKTNSEFRQHFNLSIKPSRFCHTLLLKLSNTTYHKLFYKFCKM